MAGDQARERQTMKKTKKLILNRETLRLIAGASDPPPPDGPDLSGFASCANHPMHSCTCLENQL